MSRLVCLTWPWILTPIMALVNFLDYAVIPTYIIVLPLLLTTIIILLQIAIWFYDDIIKNKKL